MERLAPSATYSILFPRGLACLPGYSRNGEILPRLFILDRTIRTAYSCADGREDAYGTPLQHIPGSGNHPLPVTRHRALRSSDFPLPASKQQERPSESPEQPPMMAATRQQGKILHSRLEDAHRAANRHWHVPQFSLATWHPALPGDTMANTHVMINSSIDTEMSTVHPVLVTVKSWRECGTPSCHGA